MFVLHKLESGYRGVFVCDICGEAIKSVGEAKAIIAGSGSKYSPRSQIHTKCLDKDSLSNQDIVMTLQEFIKEMTQKY